MMLPDFLEGAIDLHVHSAPDVDPRRYDDIDLAREAARAGMGAILIKSHQTSTVERAFLVQRIVPEIRVFGGLVLNEPVGGLNPAAVRVALQLGAKQIWMPTRSAANHKRAQGGEGGIHVLNGDNLRPEVEQILRMITEAGCILGTGHLSPEETFAIVQRAAALGLSRVLITHPEWSATHFSISEQRSLASFGNVMFERCFVSTTHRCGYIPMPVIESAIAQVGITTTVISTDLGQPDTPPPVEGFRMYAASLRAAGFHAGDIRRMMCDNAEALLSPPKLTDANAILDGGQRFGICAPDASAS
jgi:hypothetical protein